MRGFKSLLNWTKKYILIIILLLVLAYFLQYTLSFISLAVSYVFKVLQGNDPSVVNLPRPFMKIFEQFDDKLQIIIAIGIFIISIQIIRSIFRYISNYLQGSVANKIAVDMKINLYSHISNLSYLYHNNSDKGDLIQRCTSDIDTASRYPSREFVNFINIFLTVGIGAYQVFRINVYLMVACIITLPITVVLSFIFYSMSNKRIAKVEKLEARMSTIINENVTGARVVRAFFNEKNEFNKMDEASKNFSNAQEKLGRFEGFYFGVSDALVSLQYALIMIVGLVLCQKGIIDSGDIVACLLLTGMILWPFRGLARTIMSYGRTNVAVNRLQDILDVRSEYEINGTKTPEIKGKIEFKNVSYSFEDENNQVLNNISFTINPGETVAIMGRTGSGKSTIANLLVRMFDTHEGEILIDGVNINDIEKRYLRQNISLILQEPFLFSRSIKENIAITDLNASDEAIDNAATISHIKEEIDKFNDGYDTLVGEKGTTLSGGQKQRIAIARTLLKTSPIIIFDDALSALDNKTDLEIRKSLKSRKNNQTMIVITHRTTTAMDADRIIILDDKKISDIGTHDELKNKEGLYSELWKIQGDLHDDFIERGNK